MTDGEIPLTDSTNLLGPNSLMPVTPFLGYGTQSAALVNTSSTSRAGPATQTLMEPASAYHGTVTEADLHRFRSSGRKKTRHKKNEPGCSNSYSNNSFDYTNMDSCVPQTTTERFGGDSFRASSSCSGRMRTTTGRSQNNMVHYSQINKWSRKNISLRAKCKEHKMNDDVGIDVSNKMQRLSNPLRVFTFVTNPRSTWGVSYSLNLNVCVHFFRTPCVTIYTNRPSRQRRTQTTTKCWPRIEARISKKPQSRTRARFSHPHFSK